VTISAFDSLPPLREVIAAHGLSAKKGLGQNFILDLNLTRRIAREAGFKEGETVYEVGPGPGGLTRALLMEGAGCVIAVERDARCVPILAEIASVRTRSLELIGADAMAVDERAILSSLGVALPVPVVSNLPYNVGTALLIKWLTAAEWPSWWAHLTLMFQAEVAERLIAQPGDNAYGRLSVLAQWRSVPRILFPVGRKAFVPPPNVDSAIVHVTPLAEPRFPARQEYLEKVTAAAFGQRRKMLRGSLKTLTPHAAEILQETGIDGSLRAEDLSLEQFCAIARAYGARAS